MAQNITLLGASYSDVPAVLLPKTGGGTARFDDCSVVTAAAADVASGKVFIASDGTVTTGTSSGGGGHGYTLLGSNDFSANTTSTSNTSLGSITVAAAWTKAKIIYVRVRDKAGKRAGYFYGSDVWFVNSNLANGSTSTFATGARAIIRYSTSSQFATYTGTGYGVFGYDINSSGRVRIYTRYNSTNSLTINGTYHCEVYALDWPDGVSPFA